MGGRAKEYVEQQYTWPRVLEAYENLFEDVSQGRAGRAHEVRVSP